MPRREPTTTNDSSEPTTRYFAGLLDELRRAGPSARAALLNTLVGAAYARTRRLTQAIIRGELQLPNAVETDDILQDSFADFARMIADGLGEAPSTPEAMFACLCAIIRRRAVDTVRKYLGRKFRTQFPGALPDGIEYAKLDPDLESVVLRLTINELVETLAPDDQRLLNLLFFEERTYPEVAAELGRTIEAVRWREKLVLIALGKTAREKLGRNSPPVRPPVLDP